MFVVRNRSTGHYYGFNCSSLNLEEIDRPFRTEGAAKRSFQCWPKKPDGMSWQEWRAVPYKQRLAEGREIFKEHYEVIPVKVIVVREE